MFNAVHLQGKDPVKELFVEKLKSLSKQSTPQEVGLFSARAPGSSEANLLHARLQTLKKVVEALKKRA